MDWLTAKKLPINFPKTKYMFITNKMQTITNYMYLGVNVDEKLTWKEHCKQLRGTISKCLCIV